MRTNSRAVLIALIVAAAIAPQAWAQDSQCHKLNFRGNFRLNGAQQHIAQADASTFPDLKRRTASDALHTLTESVQAGGADLFTTWYLFGRAYLILNDLSGADSALTRAAAIPPADAGCAGEILRLRKNAWVPLQREAISLLQEQKYDSGLVLLRLSNRIYREDPGAFMNMASAYMSLQKEDSAALMYRMAAHAGDDPARAELRATAMLTAARLLHRNNQFMAAESVYREIIALKPRDMGARGALATVLAAQSRNTDAAAIYDSMITNADSLDSFQLFDIGVSLFNLASADSARADSVQRKGLFARSARAFEASSRKNPAYRDALYNLTNTYIAAGETENALAAAKRLLAVDSLTQRNHLLLAAQYQELARRNARRDSTLRARHDSLPQAAQYAATTRAYRDSVVIALTRSAALPYEITTSTFAVRDSSARIRGAVRNLKDAEHAGFNLVIEFLNLRGEVIASERVEIPALNATGSPGQLYDFDVQTVGRGIVAYRYKVT